MSKKILRVVSILFLSSIFVLSCSNKDKTGDGTQTVQGIAKYAGTWIATFDENTSYEVVICNDGTVTIKDGTNNPKQATDITENVNTYTMTVQHISGVDNAVTITFTDANNGTIEDGQYTTTGVIKKQNGGNKGLWYYAGTWTLTFDQQPTQDAQNPTITIGDNGSVTFDGETSSNVTDKGNEIYDVKFTPINESEFILTLTFTTDTEGTFNLSGSGSCSMEKQKQQK